MSKTIDALTKEYISQNEIFADIVNYIVYNGTKQIKPENLTAINPVETVNIKTNSGKFVSGEKIRDLLKKLIIKQDDSITYVLVGIENQTDVHYAMSVKNLLYDALNYSSQVSDIASARRKAGKEALTSAEKRHYYGTKAEFLSGFGKDDKLIPVITITVYWGDSKWDAPRKLSDMFDIKDERLHSFVNDYKLNMIIPSEIHDVNKFASDFQLVIQALAARNSKKDFYNLLSNNEQFYSVDVKTADLISELTTLKLPKAEGGRINMCKAVEELKQDFFDEGKEVGIEQGMKQGIEQGIEQGMKNGKRQIIITMINNGVSDDFIIKNCNVTLNDLEQYKKEAQ